MKTKWDNYLKFENNICKKYTTDFSNENIDN